MTEECRKGAELIWMQCDSARFPEGRTLLEKAAAENDADAWYFLGICYSWGGGDVGFSEEKAAECFRKGIQGGSALAVLGAMRAGLWPDLRKTSSVTPEESFRSVREAAEGGDIFAAWQLAQTIEWEDLETERKRLTEEKPAPVIITVPGECVPWYRKAAEGGIIQAMEKAGQMSLAGTYGEPDAEAYSFWVEKCAAAGSAWGLCEMGIYYASAGEAQTAREYLLAADSQGDARAVLPLGRLFLEDESSPETMERALGYLQRAAEQGDPESFRILAAVYDRGIRTERDVKKACYWYQRAFRAGDADAGLTLGKLYMEDTEIRNGEKAVRILEQTAETEDGASAGEACRILGQIYHDGLGGVPDGEAAIHWYTAGAGFGNADCMERLGILYCLGEDGIEKDYEKAFHWLNLCWEKGTLHSCSRLAGLYLRGEGCEADEEKAVRLFETAARTEFDGYAYCELGRIYEARGSAQDLAKAVEYYGKSMELGNETAARRLARFKKGMFGRWKVVEEE